MYTCSEEECQCNRVYDLFAMLIIYHPNTKCKMLSLPLYCNNTLSVITKHHEFHYTLTSGTGTMPITSTVYWGHTRQAWYVYNVWLSIDLVFLLCLHEWQLDFIPPASKRQRQFTDDLQDVEHRFLRAAESAMHSCTSGNFLGLQGRNLHIFYTNYLMRMHKG